jgi:hypothetical protein
MTTCLTIAEIEQAINFWRPGEVPGENGALCARARTLPDVYGLMIYEHASSVDVSRLTPGQTHALRGALHHRELPL